jgi:two-component sensor histidine kinase
MATSRPTSSVVEVVVVMREALDILERERPEIAHPPPPALQDTGRSRFETMARLSARPSPHVEQLLDVLLATARPKTNPGPAVLRPIWAEEAMHRSCAMVRLLDSPGRRSREAAAAQYDRAVAQDLGRLFQSLDEPSACQDVPCSSLLREIVIDLVTLFGTRPASAEIALLTNIERLYLPAFKRRALILAAVELVINAMLHAFTGRTQGRIDVSLTMLGPVRARLEVKDDGVGFSGGKPNLRCGIAAGLADLLEADLVYFRGLTVTTAEIVFPVRTG